MSSRNLGQLSEIQKSAADRAEALVFPIGGFPLSGGRLGSAFHVSPEARNLPKLNQIIPRFLMAATPLLPCLGGMEGNLPRGTAMGPGTPQQRAKQNVRGSVNAVGSILTFTAKLACISGKSNTAILL